MLYANISTIIFLENQLVVVQLGASNPPRSRVECADRMRLPRNISIAPLKPLTLGSISENGDTALSASIPMNTYTEGADYVPR